MSKYDVKQEVSDKYSLRGRVFHKIRENKLNFKEITIDITRFYHQQLFYNNMFAEISFYIKSRTIKDKTIKIFANELESYIRKIYYALT